MIERKVAAGAGAAAVVGFIIWLLDMYVFDDTEMPEQVITLITWLIPALAALVGGYLAPHTHRPSAPGVAAPPTSPAP